MQLISFGKRTVVASRICVAMLLLLSVIVPSRHGCRGCPIELIEHLSGGECCCGCLAEIDLRDIDMDDSNVRDGAEPLTRQSPVSGRCPLCGDSAFSTDDSVCVAVEARSATHCVDRQSTLFDRFCTCEFVALMAFTGTEQNHSVLRSVATRTLPLRL